MIATLNTEFITHLRLNNCFQLTVLAGQTAKISQ